MDASRLGIPSPFTSPSRDSCIISNITERNIVNNDRAEPLHRSHNKLYIYCKISLYNIFFYFVVKEYLCSWLGRVEIPTFIFFFLSTIVSCFHSQQQYLKCICLLGQLESLYSKTSTLFNGNRHMNFAQIMSFILCTSINLSLPEGLLSNS